MLAREGTRLPARFSDETPTRGVSLRMVSTLAPALRLPHRRTAARERAARPDFGEVAAEHLDAVYRYVHGMVRDAELAEDLTASSFEKALRAWESYRPERSRPQTWLCSIARNVVVDHWRGERRRRDGFEALAAESARTAASEPSTGLDPALEAAVRRLSGTEREVLALRVLLDMSCEDAAQVIGISPTACSTHLHRVLAKLRAEVAR
jgi:RNA polymerase sigma-70 factor, ECF subfamily